MRPDLPVQVLLWTFLSPSPFPSGSHTSALGPPSSAKAESDQLAFHCCDKNLALEEGFVWFQKDSAHHGGEDMAGKVGHVMAAWDTEKGEATTLQALSFDP